MVKAVIDEYREAYSGLPPKVWCMATLSFVNRSGTMVIGYLMLYLTQARGFSVEGAGNALLFWGLGSCAGAWLGGQLTDRIGPKNVIMGSLFLGGTAFLGLSRLTAAEAIVPALFCTSLCTDAIRPANASVYATICPKEILEKAYAVDRLAVNLGMAIGSVLGGVLAEIDYTLLFYVDGGTCLAAGALVALFLVIPRSEKAAARSADSGSAASPLRDGAFVIFLLLLTVLGTAFFQIFGTYMLHLNEVNGFAKDTIGVLIAINTTIIVLVEMILVHRLKHFHPLRMLALGCLFVGVGLGIMPFGTTVAWVILSIVLWTIGEMLFGPMSMAFVGRRAPPESRGRYMSLFTLSFSAAIVLAPRLGATLYGGPGPTTLWLVMGGATVLLCPAFLILSSRVQR